VLLYNIKTYWLQSNKELEWQIKKESKSGILEHYRAEYISLIHIYKFYSIKKIFVLSFTLDFS